MLEFDATDGDEVAIDRPDGDRIDAGVAVSFREENPDRATGRIERVDDADAEAPALDALADGEFAISVSAAGENATYRLEGCRTDDASADVVTWDAESVITRTDDAAEGDRERKAGEE